MKTLWQTLRTITLKTLSYAFRGWVFCMLFSLFFGPPIALLAESIDMLRMRSTADGTLDEISVRLDYKGRSRPVFRYSFRAAGQRYESDRYLPGFAANYGRWTGGRAVARDYQVGQAVTIHYSASDPNRCALEYGWFKVSLGFTLAVWGMLIGGISHRERRRTHYPDHVSRAGGACILYAVALLLLGPTVVRPSELHWHALAWCAAFAVVSLYHLVRQRPTPQGHPLDPEPELELHHESPSPKRR